MSADRTLLIASGCLDLAARVVARIEAFTVQPINTGVHASLMNIQTVHSSH